MAVSFVSPIITLVLLLSTPILISNRNPNLVLAVNDVHLNQIQVIHAHNSYHLAPHPELIHTFNGVIIRYLISDLSDVVVENLKKLDTTLPPITELLNTYSVRSFELDCYHDPEGGLFATPAAPKIASYKDEEEMPQSMYEPGWKVLHIPDIDYLTTCHTLKECLTEIKEWSNENPNHLPIFVHIEPKTDDASVVFDEQTISIINGLLQDDPEGSQALVEAYPIDTDAIKTLISEILDVFDSDDLLYPDALITDTSLQSSVINNNWPLLSEVRGKVILIMSEAFSKNILTIYPNLKNSPIFTSSYTFEDADDSVLFLLPDSESPNLTGNESEWQSQIDEIKNNVLNVIEEGYMVKAFADYQAVEARIEYTYRREEVISMGAHMVATDFPSGWTSPTFESDYTVYLSNIRSPAICNVITTQDVNCTSIEYITPNELPIQQSSENAPSNSGTNGESNSIIVVSNGASLCQDINWLLLLLVLFSFFI